MTAVFYKVDQFFTRSYVEAKIVSKKLDIAYETWHAEFPNIDELEKFKEITLNDLIEKYRNGEVFKF